MKTRYLIRLDDACPTMDHEKWGRMEILLEKYGIKPMVGVIPYNEDTKQQIDPENSDFWEYVKSWKKKGWAIALHGYNHCYTSNKGLLGLNPMWERSEFSGLPLDEQREKIRKGIKIMQDNGLNPQYFFAPSHTFDNNTLIALKEESDIRIISDSVATKPYKMGEFIVIPQLGGHCKKMAIPGYWTFCLHPNMMTDENFVQTESFIKDNKANFIGFDELCLNGLKNKDLFSRFLSWLYFTQRKIRGIK